MRIIPALSLLPLLAACAVAPENRFPSRCGPEFDMMTGRNIGEFDLPPSLPHRIAQPGAHLTEDFNPARLTVFVDDKGWVQRVQCG